MKFGKIRRYMVFFSFIVLCGIFSVNPLAAEAGQEKETVRVAFPEVKGYSETDAYGNRSGITYDFLSEIAKYTGWEYEFVDGSYEELMEEIEAGRIDLIGGMFYREEMKETVVYPEYGMGCNYSLLLTRKDNQDIKAYDRRTMDGKTIGVYGKAVNKIEKCRKYLDFYDLNCNFIYYDDIEEYQNCLEKKETDLMLGSDTERKEEYNVAGRFANEDNYLVAGKKSGELLPELNRALKNIYEANPDFEEELYTKYFSDVCVNTIHLDEDQKEFIGRCGAVRVAVPEDIYPLNYMYEEEERGIIRDVAGAISERTGLSFEFVKGRNYEEVIDLVKSGKADIAGYFLDDNDAAKENGLMITKPYAEVNEVLILNKGVTYPGEDLTAAVPKGKQAPDYAGAAKSVYEDDYYQCVKAVNRGKADLACMPIVFAEAVFQKENISNIRVLVLNDQKTNLSFALSQSAPEQLYSIINKTVNSLTGNEINRIIESNQLYRTGNQVSFSALMNTYPKMFIGVITIIVILISAAVLIIFYFKMSHKLMQGELKQAEAANEAKTEFLSRMSHNLRTPVNTIMGLVRLIHITGNEPPETEEKLVKIDASSQYLLSLLNDILDMSKIESCKMNLQVTPFRIDRLITQIKCIMCLQAEEKDICFECFSRTEHQAFIGDELKIKQSIINLLANSLKFTPSGGTAVFCVEEQGKREGRAVLRFSVRDSGIGIKEEDYTKIFEAFEQVTENGEDIKGTGLGLTISAHFIRLMGGEIKVDSKPGEGTEFYFTLELPIAGKAEIEEKEKSLLKEETMKKEPEKDEFKGMTVLLAEDNELNAEIVVSILGYSGVNAEHACNGRQAVDLFLSRPENYYDAVLMDIQMPVMDGFAAAEAIRNSGRSDAAVPIAAMTANTFQEDRDRAVKAGMDDFIAKPFELGEIYRVFRKFGTGGKTERK